MRRSRERDPGDPHIRFEAWLVAGGGEEPPRDLALHASVCPDCARTVAAHDLLVTIDPGLAPMPAVSAPVRRSRSGPARTVRFALAAGGALVLAGAVGFGAGQLVDLRGVAPEQEVLGGTGTPAATISPTPSPSP